MGRVTFIVFIFAALVFGIIVGTRLAEYTGFEGSSIAYKKLNDAVTVIERQYVDPVNEEKLTVQAIDGMLESLDPHSVYMTAEQVRLSKEDFSGNFDGIGIEFDIIHDTLIVVAPISGGPSEQLGIQAGDRIIQIDDESAIGITSNEVIRKLRGKKGTKVQVLVLRSVESEPIAFTIVRDKIPTFSVDLAMMLDEQTGFIKISKFVQTTHSEFVEAVKELRNQGMKRLVLDLRGNPGGFLDQAVLIADEFLDGGKKIVYTVSRIEMMNQTEFSKPGDLFEKDPVIVLVDKGSASASEIVSGALQDHDRAIIVGQTTFGKGLVQRQFEFSDGSAMRVTVSRYYTPLGRQIQRQFSTGAEGRRDYYLEAYNRKAADALLLDKNINMDSLWIHERVIETAKYIMPDSLHPVFKTPSGRVVLGGGGIMPDYMVKVDTVTKYFRNLRNKRVFEEVALSFLAGNNEKVKTQYEGDMKKFRDEFQVTGDLLQKVIINGKKSGVLFDGKAYEKDKQQIKLAVKGRIARQIWGFKGEIAMTTQDDAILEEALTLFPKATLFSKAD
ncbi:carboxyl-terminal protease [Chloroherpeton thalassium ATCC 35110]|uniref:Carboxyl-terminal protease n=1 Tax=Chloroherpeton thalassium (strain ATCC 35110 / GB-78) TaxID=517418 RepID=B3QWP0_CHLT3|nr:S41 family peptidase [Chloroherpeton thalassium]ACF14800.1 carboxyl-terminal protease [Chloroherpeton thalassium ATCC 35110]